jgi:hypothetical protein
MPTIFVGMEWSVLTQDTHPVCVEATLAEARAEIDTLLASYRELQDQHPWMAMAADGNYSVVEWEVGGTWVQWHPYKAEVQVAIDQAVVELTTAAHEDDVCQCDICAGTFFDEG